MGSQNQNAGMTLCTAKAGLAEGTTTTFTRAADVEGFIRGKWATPLASASNQASPTTDWAGNAFTALTANQGCIFVYCIVAAGTIAIVQGEVADVDDDGAFVISPQFPAIDDTLLPFGYAVVKLDNTASAWTIGTTNWTSTGVVATHADIACLPDRPQIA